jgi:hypothetical protein
VLLQGVIGGAAIGGRRRAPAKSPANYGSAERKACALVNSEWRCCKRSPTMLPAGVGMLPSVRPRVVRDATIVYFLCYKYYVVLLI